MLMKKTAIERKIVTIDATGQSIGRLASAAARLLQGKHKAAYEAHVDHGDKVEIRNAAKVKILGANKLDQKKYYQYSGYPGGMRVTQLKTVLAKNPAQTIERAVYSMLPKNRLRRDRLKRLSVHND
ncbi:50S ribosomal protein L13 [Candidatus Uhrbacteria bacterium RIFCSPHIGHO2_02_FULL_60_10]|uniref:Large ribosomal subunit protein uL13 n=1 Tax=Candidatus Uhrbacteria bacterium RIFCSPHIGHO2_02_FULL_60_10 TaxID=1802392 RepID=A0A1F7U5E3_9BACT|nr:MAG: 50S ribosomal protein L13 [Candidatus Uhrbacteria bacterium RIFCSPHIGHO2_02_FULL_60_10]